MRRKLKLVNHNNTADLPNIGGVCMCACRRHVATLYGALEVSA